MAKPKATISWSGGKDAALALYKILQSNEYEVASLHTAFDEKLKRVGMHGIPEALIEQQAASIDLPLEKIYLPVDNTHQSYEEVMEAFCLEQKEKGVEAIVYGDILLEDLKAYREKQLDKVGMKAVFPLWNAPTNSILEEFIEAGLKTLICCLNAEILPKDFLGKTIDKALGKRIAPLADPCGENGEFHTFIYGGPLFKKPLNFEIGEAVLKSYSFKKEEEGKEIEAKVDYWFQELLPLSV